MKKKNERTPNSSLVNGGGCAKFNGSNLYDREVIGWSLSEKMKAQDTSIAVLKMARFYRPLQDHSIDCVESSISALGNVTIREYQNLMSNQSKNVA